jgi:hypothetical protein
MSTVLTSEPLQMMHDYGLLGQQGVGEGFYCFVAGIVTYLSMGNKF